MTLISKKTLTRICDDDIKWIGSTVTSHNDELYFDLNNILLIVRPKGTRCLGSGKLVQEMHLKRFVLNAWLKRCLKGKCNDAHKYAWKLQGFPYNVVNYLRSLKCLTPQNGRPCRICVWIIMLYSYNIFLTKWIFITNSFQRYSQTNSPDPRQRVPRLV